MVLLVGAYEEPMEDTGQAWCPASGNLPGNHGGHRRVVRLTTHEILWSCRWDSVAHYHRSL